MRRQRAVAGFAGDVLVTRFAAKLDDVRDEWTKFVCVEGGNVLDDAITVAPERSRSLTYRVEVLPR